MDRRMFGYSFTCSFRRSFKERISVCLSIHLNGNSPFCSLGHRPLAFGSAAQKEGKAGDEKRGYEFLNSLSISVNPILILVDEDYNRIYTNGQSLASTRLCKTSRRKRERLVTKRAAIIPPQRKPVNGLRNWNQSGVACGRSIIAPKPV